ncbi:MAG: hypothetical protein GXO89_07710 [Chlorobi bacterium]|nr:hypothetical protein [Chlorobiota bacterium]
MAYVKVWIHAVWTTKNREKFLVKNVRQKLFEHIRRNMMNLSGNMGLTLPSPEGLGNSETEN